MLAIKISIVILLAAMLSTQSGQEPVAPLANTGENIAETTTTPVTNGTHALFVNQVVPTVYEIPSAALASWRRYADRKPVLVVFAAHPFLDPLRTEDAAAVKEFVRTAAPAEIIRRGRFQIADPLFLPPQTVSAAIASGLISELVFVQPPTRKLAEVSLADFQSRAFHAGFLTEEEALALTLKDGVISGTVRGIPFRCVHPEALPRLTSPVLVHIDLSYFKDLYINAVKTPAYPLIYGLITAIRNAGWPTLEATLSYSNQEAEFSLGARFMISTLADVLYQPSLLEGGTPASWQMRADALYATDLLAKSTAIELLSAATRTNPDDPAAFYDLSMALFEKKQPDAAFAALDRAVALDSGYALAYLELAETALAIGQGEKSLELLTKAATAFPDNPFIRLGQADRLIKLGRGREAIPLLRDLQKLPWSPVYHPETPRLLREMIEVAAE